MLEDSLIGDLFFLGLIVLVVFLGLMGRDTFVKKIRERDEN